MVCCSPEPRLPYIWDLRFMVCCSPEPRLPNCTSRGSLRGRVIIHPNYIYAWPPSVESHFLCSPPIYRPGWTAEWPIEWVPNIMRVCSMGHKVGSCKAAATALVWPNAFREYAAMPAVVAHPPCCWRRSSDSDSSWACAPVRLVGTRRVGSNPASAAVR